jgi:DNA repair exonuclease SbcCD ATPase subunit
VQAHIEALKSDRELVIKNRESLTVNIQTVMARGAQIEVELRNAERALTTVTNAVGPLREQLTAIAAELTSAERESERIEDAATEINNLQQSIDRWVADAKRLSTPETTVSDVDGKLKAFTESLQKYLVALGHSEVNAANSNEVIIDKEDYTPFMKGRRLRGLGSASDQPRLVAAYSLALAAASEKAGGKHPGLLILDEPLQQNPDPKHRKQFLDFLEKQIAQDSRFQTLLFTSLFPSEIERLRKKATTVITPDGQKFLKLVGKPEQPKAKDTNADGKTPAAAQPSGANPA